MSVTTYTTVNGQILSQSKDGVVHHFVSDPLGSVVMVRDNAGNTVYEAKYDPYGNVQSEAGTNPSEFGYVGTLGYVKDTASSLYVRARYLLTNLGRWLTKDPLWPEEMAYVYSDSSPALLNDPTGLWTIGPVPCKGITGKIIKVQRGDSSGVVGGTPPRGNRDFPRTGGADCTRGFKNAQGKNCICVNGSFFSHDTGWPVGSYKDCQGRTIGQRNDDLPIIITGNGHLQGKPSGTVLPRPGERIGRTGACTDSNGNLLFLVVVDNSTGATGSSFSTCMSSICGKPNKVVMLDGSGSSQIWHNGKPIYPGDRRQVVNWIVICK